MAKIVCGSCEKCYSEYAPACRHCGKTLSQQLVDDTHRLELTRAELKGYNRGIIEGSNLVQRIYRRFLENL